MVPRVSKLRVCESGTISMRKIAPRSMVLTQKEAVEGQPLLHCGGVSRVYAAIGAMHVPAHAPLRGAPAGKILRKS